VSRADENGQSFKTTYKSECRKKIGNGGLLWTTIMTDTDTLGRTEDNCEIRFQLYKYDESGNHRKAGICATTYGQIKDSQQSGDLKVLS
jgi:hypothetical protein